MQSKSILRVWFESIYRSIEFTSRGIGYGVTLAILLSSQIYLILRYWQHSDATTKNDYIIMAIFAHFVYAYLSERWLGSWMYGFILMITGIIATGLFILPADPGIQAGTLAALIISTVFCFILQYSLGLLEMPKKREKPKGLPVQDQRLQAEEHPRLEMRDEARQADQPERVMWYEY